MQSGETHVELKALRQHGWSVSDLAREYGLSRDTVRRELASEHPRGYPERAKPIRAERSPTGPHRAPTGRLSQHPRHRSSCRAAPRVRLRRKLSRLPASPASDPTSPGHRPRDPFRNRTWATDSGRLGQARVVAGRRADDGDERHGRHPGLQSSAGDSFRSSTRTERHRWSGCSVASSTWAGQRASC